ncbi:hypothetical protein [Ligilactobacillus acidipiscis]|uniref:hypothetical protein n=1 Tax=Ligilactobacillus acidipiscis TaxID=89059 RepID=UPI0023F6D4B8|nr:hypothetical protein [Ligilactobacillus acidipiscis]WEV56165.1 hypothetical protein OZX66_07870 [Ligilactobacillus acidipiscis]
MKLEIFDHSRNTKPEPVEGVPGGCYLKGYGAVDFYLNGEELQHVLSLHVDMSAPLKRPTVKIECALDEIDFDVDADVEINGNKKE